MSGIYGICCHDGQPSKTPAVSAAKVADAMDTARLISWNEAYGSDSENLHADDTMFLGCFYEKLSDTSPKSTPVLQINGKYAVIDALLYNRDELIEKSGLSDTLSDEELIFGYTEKCGFEVLKNFNGDFAGAVYDPDKGTLTLFRDHMGVRPLFYQITARSLVFSTDIRGITAMHSADVSVDEDWLYRTISGSVSLNTEHTEFANIRCVKPASFLTLDLNASDLQAASATKTTTYWVPGGKKIRLSSEADYIMHLRELITDSVKRRLDAISGPVGAELSGGLDSSVIDILIKRLEREAVYVSWSASPDDIPYAQNDERHIVEDICRQENIKCHYRGKYVQFDDDAIINTKMRALGIEPDTHVGFFRRFVLPPYISTLQIAQVAEYVHKQGCRVVFTGHSGDEGVSHRCNPYELFYNKEYYHYFKYMWDSTKDNRHRLYKTVIRAHKNLFKTARKLKSPFVSSFAAKSMLKKEFSEKYSTEKEKPSTFAYDPVTYVREGGSRNRLDIVALLGAYCGARYIAPYTDYRLIDYALSIPRHMYLKNGKNRYIFKEAFKDIMPESLYNLTGKEDTSWQNMPSAKHDLDAHLERKKRLVGMLDKDYWDSYLDWSVLSEWACEADTSKNLDTAMLMGIDNCLSLQNVITFSRAIKTN